MTDGKIPPDAPIDEEHDPDGYLDVGGRIWNEFIGLVMMVESGSAHITATLELSSDDMRDVAAALN